MTTPTPNPPAPPATLQPAGRGLWEAIVSDYDLEPVDLARLATACCAIDRAEAAAAEVRRDGLLVTMPSGARRPHPAVRIEAESRALFLRSLRELDLDAEAIPEAVRPPALRSIAGGRS